MPLPGVKRQKAVDDLFKNSKNTMDEATRMRELRDRSFTNTNSIFTNPLKPVMPLHGPPLESIIKTGPGMPGVSIAMMTPTEMLQLQREVHSLRFQLLDRTRECPYADCDRYFTFADAEGLDRHVREDHNVLRCFLCDKDEHLLPYYDTEQIKKHFVTEHVSDILKAFGKSGTQEASTTQTAGKPLHREATPSTSESSSDSETSESEEEQESMEQPIQQEQQAHPKKPTKAPKSANPFALTLSSSDSDELTAVVPPTAAPKTLVPERVTSLWEQPADFVGYGGPQAVHHGLLTPKASTPNARVAQTRDWGAIINRRRAGTVAVAAAAKTPKAAPGSASGPTQTRAGLDESFDFFQGGQTRRKRKRPASLNVAAYASSSSSGSEGYEYSERSAVPDPVENLAATSPAKKRRAGPPPPTPVAANRTGRTVRPTRSVI
ncbi:hypothetical protein GGR51DRAFT_526575 [Nemania sp. FL0031]|nr:hypothetical protein GGR51DRAFT_526575 [Nemania sp. FL0031]